jgi:hypothetical protein
MYAALVEQLDRHEARPKLFTDGKPEQTLLWEEDGVMCKARLDWLRSDLATVDDLKTTSRSARTEAYARRLSDFGADLQAAFYLRGLAHLFPDARPTFRWAVIETQPPYALNVISPGADMLELGRAKVERALRTWRECLERNSWPGYGQSVAYAELPPWEEARFLEQEEVVA